MTGPSLKLDGMATEEAEQLIMSPKFKSTADIISTCTLDSQEEADMVEQRATMRTTMSQGPDHDLRLPGYSKRKLLRQIMVDNKKPVMRVGTYTSKDPTEIAHLLGMPKEDVERLNHRT